MPSYLREPSDSACWNCDRGADEIVDATLHLPSGDQLSYPLCRDCRRSAYPRAAALAGVTITARAGQTGPT